MEKVRGLRNRNCYPYKYEIGDVISWGRASKFKILDRKISIDKTKGYKFKEYFCECLNCHHKQWYREHYFHDVIRENKPGNGCRVCGNTAKKYYIDEKSSIAATEPWMIPLLKDPQDAKRICGRSKKKTFFICPQCGGEVYTSPDLLRRAGRVVCPRCSDYFSIPNKFALSVLRQCDIENLKSEYSPSWAGLRRYDFSFWKNGQHYILQMDGGFHFNTAFGITPEEKLKIDADKQLQAEKHGCIVIRVLALESNVDYLKEQVIQSNLSKIVDLSLVDWAIVQKDCIDSTIVKVCSLYNEGLQLGDIEKKLYISKHTVIHGLEVGREIGLCNYKTKYEVYQINYQNMIRIENEHPEYTNKQIREMLNVSSAIYNQMHLRAAKAGLLKDPRTDPERRRDEIIDFILKNPNKPRKFYCDNLNICYSTVAHCIDIIGERKNA